jgi:protoporphyrinogen oxidase
MKKKKILILGGGIAGLSAGYFLKKYGISNVIIEKNERPGGLLDNIQIKGFTFDNFIHLSLAKDKFVKNFFKKSTESFIHNPQPNNYYKGKWITHSPQNHLYPLGIKEKFKIIISFILRKKIIIDKNTNYEDWLKSTYGEYFARNFPMQYTLKYWKLNAKKMSSKWVGFRMNKPKLLDIIKGAFFPIYKNTYYAQNLKYPKKGGFKSYLSILLKNKHILCSSSIVEIDCLNKNIKLRSGKRIEYDRLISSIPLPEICKVIKKIPRKILNISRELKYTSGVIISLGLNKPVKTKMWFYIYDKHIKTARVHSPSIKSRYNAPTGCGSLQAEIYLNQNKKINPSLMKKIEDQTIKDLIKMKIFKRENIIVKNAKYIKYANVVFDKNIYKKRDIVRDFLVKNKIYLIGRFGAWDYLWSDQAFLSGKSVADKIKLKIDSYEG